MCFGGDFCSRPAERPALTNHTAGSYDIPSGGVARVVCTKVVLHEFMYKLVLYLRASLPTEPACRPRKLRIFKQESTLLGNISRSTEKTKHAGRRQRAWSPRDTHYLYTSRSRYFSCFDLELFWSQTKRIPQSVSFPSSRPEEAFPSFVGPAVSPLQRSFRPPLLLA